MDTDILEVPVRYGRMRSHEFVKCVMNTMTEVTSLREKNLKHVATYFNQDN